MSYVLALDQGTTSSRAIVFDADARAVAVAQEELPQRFPAPGWVEHDPEAIWTGQLRTAVAALGKAGLRPGDVAALGITNQRETAVVWERDTGRPIHPAIVWQDRRTARVCADLVAGGQEPLLQARTGLRADPYFSATKVAWILDHVDGARARAEAGELCFGTIDAWLVWRLTGGRVHATDASNASRTLLYDLETDGWSEELAELLRVPTSTLPKVVSSSGVLAETTAEGLAGIPIAGIAGDQQAALFGEACFEKGQAKNTYGTGCFLLLQTGTDAPRSTKRLLTTVAWRIEGRTEHALEGSVFAGGSVVQWLRDGLGIVAKAADVEALARSVPDTGGVVLVPAFTGLGAPHWAPDARGLLTGITRGTTRAHLARAALESIALQVADVADAMTADTKIPLAELRVDGGAARDDLLLQMQADFLQVPVVRPRVTETTALGAAYLAGLAVGVWKDRSEVARRWAVDRRFEPEMSEAEAASHRARWLAAVRRALT